MKKTLQLLVFFLLLNSCNNWKNTATFQYSELNAKDFQEMLRSNSDCILIDVRTKSEYDKGHIKNAINISYFAGNFRKKTANFPKDKIIFMYCQTQHRSPFTSKIMKKEGFSKIIDLSGGFVQW